MVCAYRQHNTRQIVKHKNKKTRKQQRGGGWWSRTAATTAKNIIKFRNRNRIQPSDVITAESEAAREEAARAVAVMASLAAVRARARLAEVRAAAATNASRKIQSRVRGKQTRKKFINNICPICYDPMIHNVSITLPCNHKFHSHCIRRWNETNRTCPLCREIVTNIIKEEI